MKKVCSLVHNSHPSFNSSIVLLVGSWVSEGYINNECIFVSSLTALFLEKKILDLIKQFV